MHKISASELKQNSMRLQEALRDDLLVTKRDKPFVVVMDYEKYKKIQNTQDEWSFWSDNKLDDFDDEDKDY